MMEDRIFRFLIFHPLSSEPLNLTYRVVIS